MCTLHIWAGYARLCGVPRMVVILAPLNTHVPKENAHV